MTTKPADALDLGLREMASRLREGHLTAVSLAEAVLARISERNGGNPSFDGSPSAVNAWSSIDPATTLEQAATADRRLAAGDDSLLCGIPIGVKALFAVAEKPLTASSQVLEGQVAERDCSVWRALSAAGAVYAGHTHTHEFAAGGTTDQVGNPWNLAFSAGGSSGGSSAAVAAGMVPAALGTDTAGSLRIPAALTGISAFKASFGRIPVDGVIPLSPTLDHAGPMARTLADCAALLPTLTGADGGVSPWGVGSRDRLPLVEGPAHLRGRRIAMTDRADSVTLDPDIREGLVRARAAAEELGATIVEIPAVPDFAKADFDTILIAETRSYHGRHASRADDYRGSTREFINPGAPSLPVDLYLTAQERRLAFTQRWANWFVEHEIDALLEPTSAITARERGHGYDAGRPIGGTDPLTCFTATWNLTGFPVAALPAGLGSQSGLPVGVSLIGAPLRDAHVLALGIGLQQLLPPPLRVW